MKNSFLSLVARDLYQKKGHHLNRIALVFPGKRARLFFNEALYEYAGKPVWTPQYLSISDLFALCKVKNKQGKIWSIGDPILLNGILFQEYRKIFKESRESFDEFYAWGKVLLRDFDNIDKNLADAQGLFRLISETEALKDDFGHLTEEQLALVKSFFRQFNRQTSDEEPSKGAFSKNPEESRLKKNFVHLWNKMFPLYSAFKQRLASEAVVYEGMLTREIVEHITQYGDAFKAEAYAFVGFNALNKCEETFFLYLKNEGKALFYWDYDHYYTEDKDHLHEAGRFMRRNLQLFPNELEEHSFDTFTKTSKQIEIIASPTENAQTHYAAADWLKRHHDADTAIVLCNESLLLPMLHSLPADIGEFNITMGYPMRQSPVFALLQLIIRLHSEGCQRLKDGSVYFRSKFSLPVLQHPDIRCASKKAAALAYDLQECHYALREAGWFLQDQWLACLFRPVESALELGRLLLEMIRLLAEAEAGRERSERAFSESKATGSSAEANPTEMMLPLYQESLFLSFQALNHLQDLMQEGIIDISIPTYRRLFTQVMNLSIPFSGEPLGGVQVMGLLETRNLDFENLLILSVNEGYLPKNTMESSFIPYHLRMAYGLTMPQHQDAISAYYFMRMLQRAKHITLTYCHSTQGNKKGEMSRFILQLLMESGINIQQSAIVGKLGTGNQIPRISREGVVLPETLSPSKLKSFISCETKFYYEAIAKLKALEETKEEMDVTTFGNIFHATVQYLYTELLLKQKGLPHDHASVLCKIADRTSPLEIEVEKSDIEALLKNKTHIREALEIQTQILYFKNMDHQGKSLQKNATPQEYNGSLTLNLKVLQTFVERLLAYDMDYAPFRILDMEMPIASAKPLDISEKHHFSTHGIIDRIDFKDNVLRILDYKTGSLKSSPITWEKLFCEKASSFQLNALQTYLYAMMLQAPDTVLPDNIAALAHREDIALHTALFYPQAASDKHYRPDFAFTVDKKEKQENYRRLHDSFQEALCGFLDQHYFHSQEAFFKRTNDERTCEYCDFANLCLRKKK